ncbi:hypothetical protein MRO13_15230 [Vibrio metschnikovii]|uniref:Uncharacterized protein n=1 Tax=bacterium 19CA03SA04 TaxID=2920698 RepID=A0AAU6T1J1_UNCXX|nr:hypothetical protein [Vibrio paracholerae]EKO3778353.1 hypothetical protein [Vibrio metschnikovii]MCO7028165.1 hypothetical protein [Vibrio paracholerae]
MANSVIIQQLNNQLKVNSDAYDLSRIVGVEVKVLTFKDHLLRMLLLGAISSSLLFIFIPSEHQNIRNMD